MDFQLLTDEYLEAMRRTPKIIVNPHNPFQPELEF